MLVRGSPNPSSGTVSSFQTNDEQRSDAAATALHCRDCGACCAYSESWPAFIGDSDGAGIPEEYIDFDHARMQCYGQRCSALAGEIGRRVHCAVYANRPLVCREFQAGSDDCIMVRRSFDLPVT